MDSQIDSAGAGPLDGPVRPAAGALQRYALDKAAPGMFKHRKGQYVKHAAAVAAIAEAVAAERERAALPERMARFTLRDMKEKRAELDGFIALGNELERAREYDVWIAALELYCEQYTAPNVGIEPHLPAQEER